jgi:hypothetical protein
MVGPVNVHLRLGRLMCGKASPFRRTRFLKNFLPAGWKAQPSSLRGGKGKVRTWPESRRSCEIFEFSIFRLPVIKHLRAEEFGYFKNFTASEAFRKSGRRSRT